jgi:hypothetical protein
VASLFTLGEYLPPCVVDAGVNTEEYAADDGAVKTKASATCSKQWQNADLGIKQGARDAVYRRATHEETPKKGKAS